MKVADEQRSAHPDRRSFLRSVGLASLGVAAAGLSGPSPSTAPGVTRRPRRLDPEAPLRIGMIGTTGHTELVFDHLDEVPGARIAAYAFEDDDWAFNTDGSRRGHGAYDLAAKRRWAASRPWYAQGIAVYETYQEMIDKEPLDLVVICLPYARNAYATVRAAEAGLPVLCEKPVAVNDDDLDRVARAVQQNGIRLSAMFAMRFAAPYAAIKRAVEQGRIGTPCLGRAQKSYKWGRSRPWFYKDPEIYGSSLLWVGIHAVDYLRWTMGREIRQVSAMHGNLAHPAYPGAQDHGVVNLRFDGGATAAVTFDYLRPAGATSHGDDRLRVVGTRGVVEKRVGETVELTTDEQPPTELPPVSPPSLFADFVGELRGQGTHRIGPEEAVRVTRLCIAATRAAEEGRTLDV